MPAVQDLPSPVREFYTAFQKGDLDTMRTLYAPEAVLRDPGVGFLLGHTDILASGVENILKYYYAAFSNMPEAPRVDVRRFWQTGDEVIVEHAEGMMTYLEIFTVTGGRIAGQQVFWGSIPPAPLLRSRAS